jgi:hypothetical protein
MNNLWDSVRKLTGKQLSTVTDSIFHVISVTDNAVTVRVESTKKDHSITRKEIENAAALGPLETLKPGFLRQNGVAGPAGYIVGILHGIANEQ